MGAESGRGVGLYQDSDGGVYIYIYMHSRTCFPFSLRLSEIQDVYVSMIVPQVKASLLNVIIETQRGDVFDSMSH